MGDFEAGSRGARAILYVDVKDCAPKLSVADAIR